MTQLEVKKKDFEIIISNRYTSDVNLKVDSFMIKLNCLKLKNITIISLK